VPWAAAAAQPRTPRPAWAAASGKGVARTHALEALIIVGFLRGLSVRDVEALLEEALGEQVVGKSTVARICQDIRERYRAGARE